MKKSCLLAAALLCALLAPSARAACVEQRANTVANERRHSSLVVMGSVLEAKNNLSSTVPATIASTDYTFQVERQMKGKRQKQLVVHVDNVPDRFAMLATRRYLLFLLPGPNDTWLVDPCGNSGKIAEKSINKSAPKGSGH
jgi:hypothetical protein